MLLRLLNIREFRDILSMRDIVLLSGISPIVLDESYLTTSGYNYVELWNIVSWRDKKSQWMMCPLSFNCNINPFGDVFDILRELGPHDVHDKEYYSLMIEEDNGSRIVSWIHNGNAISISRLSDERYSGKYINNGILTLIDVIRYNEEIVFVERSGRYTIVESPSCRQSFVGDIVPLAESARYALNLLKTLQ